MDARHLIIEAIKAREMAYAPYSHHKVGAALLSNSGKVYTGCNIENAAYGPTNCAERTALFKAVSEGDRSFAVIAIVGGRSDKPTVMMPPCGICRQVLREFCDPDMFDVIIAANPDNYRRYKLSELLPVSFGPSDLR